MLSSEPGASLREGAQKLNTLFTAQPKPEAETEEEATQPEEEVETQETSETEESEEEEIESEEEEVEEEDKPFLELTYNGETRLVKTQEEAIELAQKGYDYSQKMSAMSDKVKTETKKLVEEKTVELEKRRADLIEATEIVEQLFNQPVTTKEKLDQLLDDEDIAQYTRLKGREDDRQALVRQVKEQRKLAVEESQKANQQKFEEVRQSQIEILLTKVPELKDASKQDELETFLKQRGVRQSTIESMIYDAELVIIADIARKHIQLVKEGIKPKPKAKNAKVTKQAGKKISKPTRSQQANKELAGRLKQSGKLRDAGKLFELSLLKK